MLDFLFLEEGKHRESLLMMKINFVFVSLKFRATSPGNKEVQHEFLQLNFFFIVFEK